MAEPTRVALATGNPAKRRRLAWLLEGLDVELTTPAPLVVDEDGATLAENARLKAHAYSATYNMLSIATDGGVSVPSLGSAWDPVRTHRAAGEDASAAGHARHLLRLAHARQLVAFQLECVAICDAVGAIVGEWQARSTPRHIAASFDRRELPDGFWLPGVLLFGPKRKRYVELSPVERAAAEDHWLALRDGVRTGVVAVLNVLNGANSPARARRRPAAPPSPGH